ncbi:hypothetical protein ACI6CX_01460 [Mammaliicoccus sciuri]
MAKKHDEWLEEVEEDEDFCGYVYDEDGEFMYYVEDGWVCTDPWDI